MVLLVGCQAVRTPAMPAASVPQSDYERVIETITSRIKEGVYQPGEQLPSIAQLAAEFNTSKTTIKNAQLVLRHSGMIYGRPGKGVYVTETPPKA